MVLRYFTKVKSLTWTLISCLFSVSVISISSMLVSKEKSSGFINILHRLVCSSFEIKPKAKSSSKEFNSSQVIVVKKSKRNRKNNSNSRIRKMDAKKQADSLEKVTDRHEERELDDAKMLQAFQSLDRSSIIQEQEKKKEELSKVVIKEEDVTFIVEQMEVDKSTAERTLRRNKGNLTQALEALIRS